METLDMGPDVISVALNESPEPAAYNGRYSLDKDKFFERLGVENDDCLLSLFLMKQTSKTFP